MDLKLLAKRCLLTVLVGFMTAGCSSAPPDGTADEQSAESPPTSRVDPQIMADVIDGAFLVPGSGIRRSMRVESFLTSIGVVECGGEPIPIDFTGDRPDQSLYPDLELIRERGFAETGPSYRDTLSVDCAEIAPDSIQSWTPWRNLLFEWSDATLEVQEKSKALEAEGEVMARCLRDRTGLAFDELGTFLLAVDNAHIEGASDSEMLGLAAAYADCGKPYFETLANELKAERKAQVERNRETLTRFAIEIADAGYVP